jgi:tetratricopeptide (TPR) repeat protein
VRIFSTLGQPNWLAAYIAVLTPIAIAFLLNNIKPTIKSSEEEKISILKLNFSKKKLLYSVLLLISIVIMYVDSIWTDSQSGFLGLWAGIGMVTFCTGVYYVLSKKRSFYKEVPVVSLLTILLVFIGLSLLLGTPIERLKNLSFSPSTDQTNEQKNTSVPAPTALPALEFGGTDSSKIRLIVWEGALNIFKSNPIFGSGVETFAYSYYQHRPAAHNLTSEWDYLYNKAHNEYLNYLATTGILGFGTYMLFIGWVIFLFAKSIWIFVFKRNKKIAEKYNYNNLILSSGLFAGWVGILVSNFFGFSVVIINLLLFILPLWIFHLLYKDFSSPEISDNLISMTPQKKTLVVFIGLVLFIFEIILFRYWLADKAYGMGNNLNKMGEYVSANQYLIDAVQKRPGEDLFKDELAVNVSTLALVLEQQGQSTQAAQFSQQSRFLSDSIIARHPNNVVYWKSRTRIMYSLAQLDPSLFQEALRSVEKASQLAPTDAKVLYNKALLYEQAGEREIAMQTLQQAIQLKPNYRDALYAKALIHSEIADAISATDSARAIGERNQAKGYLELILNYLIPTDTQASELLEKLN